MIDVDNDVDDDDDDDDVDDDDVDGDVDEKDTTKLFSRCPSFTASQLTALRVVDKSPSPLLILFVISTKRTKCKKIGNRGTIDQ